MLELQDICFQVHEDSKEKGILKHVNLKIEDGFVAVTGPNGGGKSTMAKVIAGIIRPTSGRILLNGEDITELSITERARKGISFAFQQPVRFKGLTVLDLINLAHGEALSLNGSERFPIRRRMEKDRDRHDYGKRDEAVHLRRAGGRD